MNLGGFGFSLELPGVVAVGFFELLFRDNLGARTPNPKLQLNLGSMDWNGEGKEVFIQGKVGIRPLQSDSQVTIKVTFSHPVSSSSSLLLHPLFSPHPGIKSLESNLTGKKPQTGLVSLDLPPTTPPQKKKKKIKKWAFIYLEGPEIPKVLLEHLELHCLELPAPQKGLQQG